MRRAAVVVLVAALAACSSGDHLTERQFIRQGDAICARLARSGDVLDADDVPSALDRVVALATEARTDFAALEPPEDGERVQRAMLAFLDASVANGRKARAALVRGDEAGARRAITATAFRALAAQRAAEGYGFQECGGPALPR